MNWLMFRQRLTLFSAAGIALVLVVGSAATYVVVRSQLRAQIDESLRRQSPAVGVAGHGGVPEKVFQKSTRRVSPSTGATRRPRQGFMLEVKAPKPEFGNAPSFFQVIDTQIGRASC